MTFVYIDDYNLLCKIINYLKLKKVNYTTDLEKIEACDNLLISSVSNKGLDVIKKMNSKKIIYILYPEELKILNNINNFNEYSLKYKSKIYNILNNCNIIITSMPYFKYILNKKIKCNFEIIPLENNNLITKKCLLKTYSNYKINKKKTTILVIDFKYRMLNNIYYLSNKYQNINFIYLGFKPDYLLPNSDKNIINKLPKNVTKVEYINQKQFEEIIRISKMVIFNDNILEKYFYFNIVSLLEKQLFIRKQELCYKLFINSKNCYIYETREELDKKIDKYLKNNIGNLSSNILNLFLDNSISKISDKFSKLLK